jgi:hypothetical protein
MEVPELPPIYTLKILETHREEDVPVRRAQA